MAHFRGIFCHRGLLLPPWQSLPLANLASPDHPRTICPSSCTAFTSKTLFSSARLPSFIGQRERVLPAHLVISRSETMLPTCYLPQCRNRACRHKPIRIIRSRSRISLLVHTLSIFVAFHIPDSPPSANSPSSFARLSRLRATTIFHPSRFHSSLMVHQALAPKPPTTRSPSSTQLFAAYCCWFLVAPVVGQYRLLPQPLVMLC